MRISLCILVLLTTFLSCKEPIDKIIISGNIRNTDIKKVYLTDSYEWEVLLDSSDVVDGKFLFKRKKIDFNLYSIYYKDVNGKQHSIEFINRILSPDSIKYLTNYFLLDSSNIQISGDWSKYSNHYYDLKGGSENAPLFRTQVMQFGYLDADINKRTNQLNEYVSIVKTYPNSTYLLQKLNENKSVLKKSELSLMLNTFSLSALKSKYGEELVKYLANRKDIVKVDNFIAEDLYKVQTKIYDTSVKLNMIIIWASWCGPCRQEAPVLKELYEKYKDKGLNMVGVSVDDDRIAWKQAVNTDKLNWKQVIIPSYQKNVFNTKFEVGSIPSVLFLDSTGKLIRRTIGADANALNEYTKIIEQQIDSQ